MRTKLIKVVSLVLAVVLLTVASSVVVTAATKPLSLTNDGPVVLDGTNEGKVTVSIVCNENVSYALQGKFAAPAGFTLTEIKFNGAITADTEDVTISDVSKGEIAWIDWNFSDNASGEGFVILTATYTVAAGTSAGNYTIAFTSSVYAGADGEENKTPIEVATTVKVEVNKPVTNLTVINKTNGKASYTVDGQVVTVTSTLACKLGYWDATNNKYVAIAANKISDNTYSFTAPNGVTEVLLVVKGDANGDGNVNTADTMTISRSLLLTTHPAYSALSDIDKAFAADVSGEGTVNTADTMTISRSLLLTTHPAYSTLSW